MATTPPATFECFARRLAKCSGKTAACETVTKPTGSGSFEEARRRGELRRGVDLSIARLFLFGGLNHTLEWYTARGVSFRDLAERYTELFFHGIGRSDGATA